MVHPICAKINGKPTLFDNALDYARLGWSIIPVVGKKPVGLWKPFQERPADEKTLRRLFAKECITGLAVVTGAVSGNLAVRDFDQADSYHTWADENPGDAANLPTVRTARGYHVYGRLDEETFADLGDGELRADSGHYVLLPPSLHPDGKFYTWEKPFPDRLENLPILPLSLRINKIQATHQLMQPKQPIACVPFPFFGEVIEATLPNGSRQRNQKIFALARRLKGITCLDTSPESLKAIVTEWHRRALPFITTKDFAETWTDFQIAWQRVKKPHWATIRAAYEAVQGQQQESIDGSAELGVLAAFCRRLHLDAGGEPFFLSCRKVEELFKVSRMTAWRLLQSLQFHGIIETVERGTLKDHRATTWRYIIENQSQQ